MRAERDCERPRSDEDQHGRPPLWAQARLRLVVLLTVLAGVSAYGVPRIVHEIAAPEPATACTVLPGPAPVRWSLAQLEDAVSASGMRSLVGRGSLDLVGLQEPGVAWSDQYPIDERPPDPDIMPVDAGYELRWRSPGNRDHQAADLFVFRTAQDATGYVARAASVRCRRGARAYELRQPAAARALIWTNPVGALQVDSVFSRGNLVYRVVEVPATGSRRPRAALIQIAERLACRLRGAACQPAGRRL